MGVESNHEIELNSVRYKVQGRITEKRIPRFPGRVTAGDSSFANETLLSTWNMNDFRGGIGVEEMDESKDLQTCWWSTCEIRFPRALTLPALATAATTTTLGAQPSWGDLTTEVTLNNSTTSFTISGGSFDNDWRGKDIYFGIWMEDTGDAGASLTCTIADDDSNSSTSAAVTGAYTFREVSITIGGAATSITASVTEANSVNGTHKWGAIALAATGSVIKFAVYNQELHAAIGSAVLKLNVGETGFDVVVSAPAVITDIIPSGDNLYIYSGDTVNTDYIVSWTGSVFAFSSIEEFTHGVHATARLWGIQTDGTTKSSADPELNGTATWASEGKYPKTTGGAIQRVGTYRDVSGVISVYIASETGLWIYDESANIWLETEVSLPDGTNTGKGFTKWDIAAVISAGLQVKKYTAAATATSAEIGLVRRDGLPQEYDGEIVYLINGDEELFALVDASQASGTNKSGVYGLGEFGWRCLWASTSNDQTMQAGIVASDANRRLWFSNNNTIYYIPLYMATKKPKMVSGYTYATSGVLITGRFDAGNAVFDKTAKRIQVYGEDLSCKVTISDYTALSGAVLTVNTGAATTLTENVDWTAATSNNAPATSTVAGVTGTANAAVVTVTVAAGTGLEGLSSDDTTNMSVNHEVIVVEYRINRANITVDSGWTTLGTCTADGVTEFTFGTNAKGTVFKDIQFRYELYRGDTNTNSPILVNGTLGYLKQITPKYSWAVHVEIDGGYYNKSERELYDALKTAHELTTLMDFTYRDGQNTNENHIVLVDDFMAITATEKDYKGVYFLRLVEP